MRQVKITGKMISKYDRTRKTNFNDQPAVEKNGEYFIPKSQKPANLMGRPIVGSWTDKWYIRGIDDTAIEQNDDTDNQVDWDAWVQAFGEAY